MRNANQIPPYLPVRIGGDRISGRVAQQLMQEICNGDFKQSEQLPSELALAAQLQVSRTVVRDALSELERAGAIERVRGLGTIINHDVAALRYRMDRKLEFIPLIESTGHAAHCDHVLVTKQEASAELAASLGLTTGQTVLSVCKRVLADEQPVLVCNDLFPLSLLGGQRCDGIDFSRPIFDILQDVCNIQVSSTIARPRAVIGEAAVRRLLGVSHEQALLELEEVCYTSTCKPVLHCHTYYTDFLDFSIVRKLM